MSKYGYPTDIRHWYLDICDVGDTVETSTKHQCIFLLYHGCQLDNVILTTIKKTRGYEDVPT